MRSHSIDLTSDTCSFDFIEGLIEAHWWTCWERGSTRRAGVRPTALPLASVSHYCDPSIDPSIDPFARSIMLTSPLHKSNVQVYFSSSCLNGFFFRSVARARALLFACPLDPGA